MRAVLKYNCARSRFKRAYPRTQMSAIDGEMLCVVANDRALLRARSRLRWGLNRVLLYQTQQGWRYHVLTPFAVISLILAVEDSVYSHSSRCYSTQNRNNTVIIQYTYYCSSDILTPALDNYASRAVDRLIERYA